MLGHVNEHLKGYLEHQAEDIKVFVSLKVLSTVESDTLQLNSTMCFNLWLEDSSNIPNDVLK